jgi:hypothetical protein
VFCVEQVEAQADVAWLSQTAIGSVPSQLERRYLAAAAGWIRVATIGRAGTGQEPGKAGAATLHVRNAARASRSRFDTNNGVWDC